MLDLVVTILVQNQSDAHLHPVPYLPIISLQLEMHVL